MTCHELISDFLLDYCEASLPEATRAEFESHLSICPDCQAYLANYRLAIELSRGAFAAGACPAESPPAALVEAILKARQSQA